ncbi:MAG TPA: hypothetical protein VFJ51_00210 [Nitrososphaeraceae archaeon]|nr:hypothetical protein [Nitrososphaeraceae archaeon]
MSTEMVSCRHVIVIGIASVQEDWSTPQSYGGKGKPRGCFGTY